MPRPSDTVRRAPRALPWGPAGLLLSATLLASIGLIASSCTRAFDLEGYSDAFGSACALATRCYGPLYGECSARFEKVESESRSTDWLLRVDATACLDSCNSLYRCLDFTPLCVPHIQAPGSGGTAGEGGAPPVILQPCTISEDCCGYSEGTATCSSGLCCVPTGVPCASDYDCCPGAGKCENGTCGGIVCGPSNAPCLNSFQCCSGRCGDNDRCEDIPCPPEGFECDKDTDCCDLECVPDLQGVPRCTHPVCAQRGEPCTTAADCCDTGSQCFKGTPDAPSGVCSPDACLPNEADCTGNLQGAGSACCSQYCHPQYHLCGECVTEGSTCSEAVPCCSGLTCHGGSCQCTAAGNKCVVGVLCCNGEACAEGDLCP